MDRIKLKDINVPTKRGGHWNQSTINSILNNPLYIGNVRYGISLSNGTAMLQSFLSELRKRFIDTLQLTEDEIYNKIMDDLDDVTQPGALPEAVAMNEVGRANIHTAYMLRAEVVMLKEDASRYGKISS